MATREESFDIVFGAKDKLSPEMEKISKEFASLAKEADKSDKEVGKLTKQIEDLSAKRTLIEQVSDAFGDVSVSLTSVADPLKAIAVGIAGVNVAFAAASLVVIKAGIDIDEATQRTGAALGLVGEEAKRLEPIIENVFKTGIPESIGEAAKSVELAFQRFGDIGEDALSRIAIAAQQTAKQYDEDYNKVIGAASTLTKNFGITSEEAMDFVVAGFQKGLDGSGDFLDSIGEYSVQFKEGGATASQFFSLMETGFQGGILGTDKAADAFKEFRVRVNDEVAATGDALQALGFDSQTYFDQLRDGTKNTADAFSEVIAKVNQIEDPVKKQTLLVGLLGTQLEDLGTEAFGAIDLSKTKIEDLEGSLDKLSVAFDTVSGNFTKIWRTAIVEITNLDAFEGFVEKVRGYFSDIGKNFDEAISGVDFSALEKSLNDLISVVSGGFKDLFGEIDLTTVEGLRGVIQTVVDSIARMVEISGSVAAVTFPIFQKLKEIFDELQKNSAGINEAFTLIAKLGEAVFYSVKAVGAALLTALVGYGEFIANIAEALLYIPSKIIPGIDEFREKVTSFKEGLSGFKKELAADSVDSFKDAITAGGEAIDIFSDKADNAAESIKQIPEKKDVVITATAEVDEASIEKDVKKAFDIKGLTLSPDVDTSKINETTKFIMDEYGNLKPKVDIIPVVDVAAKQQTEKELTELEKTKIEVKASIQLEAMRSESEKFIALTQQTGETAREALRLNAELNIVNAQANLKKFEVSLNSTTEVIKSSSAAAAELLGMLTGEGVSMYARFQIEEQLRIEQEIQKESFKIQKAMMELEIERLRIHNQTMEAIRTGKISPMRVTIDPSFEPAMDLVLRTFLEKIRIFGIEYGLNQLLEAS